jgi:hypothetical protein
MTHLLALLVLTQSPNTDAEIFVDRGETYIRAGQINGLEVGSALDVLDAKTRQPVGAALVMEIWESLSRVSLDSKAAAYGPLKVARVQRRPEPIAQQQMPAPLPPDDIAPAPLPSGPMPTRPPQQQGAWLDGQVTMTGAGSGRRVIIKNRSNRDWHNCDVRLPNGKHYWIGDLDAGDDEGVMLFRFDYERGAPIPQPTEGVAVVCREGMGRFPISL